MRQEAGATEEVKTVCQDVVPFEAPVAEFVSNKSHNATEDVKTVCQDVFQFEVPGTEMVANCLTKRGQGAAKFLEVLRKGEYELPGGWGPVREFAEDGPNRT